MNRIVITGWLVISCMAGCQSADTTHASPSPPDLEWVRVSDDGGDFVYADSGRRFVAWGFNYDHDAAGRLLEDYWYEQWPTVVEDFEEIKALGANTVRIHLQVAKFMQGPEQVNERALTQLSKLVDLAERTGLYLDITGLGCYHKADVPAWYDALGESRRWAVQVRFWRAVARTCADSPAVFCYDLMNEPILPGKTPETDWLAGEFGGKHFVQRISLDLAGRTRQQVAAAWVNTMVEAIRSEDDRHLITVGVIPWALTFPGAKPLFYAPDVGDRLDFVSVHFYPRSGEVDKALDALAVYDVGKPIVIEECAPLRCSVEEFDQFIDGSRAITDGYLGFYWGRTIEQYQRDGDLRSARMRRWLEYFKMKGPAIRMP